MKTYTLIEALKEIERLFVEWKESYFISIEYKFGDINNCYEFIVETQSGEKIEFNLDDASYLYIYS